MNTAEVPILETPNKDDRLLLHSCCAPCEGEVLETLLNSKIGKDWQLGKLNLKTELQGTNLLDHYYRNHLSWGQIPQMGRNITINAILKL